MEKIELYEKESYLVHLKNGKKLKASLSGYKLLKRKSNMTIAKGNYEEEKTLNEAKAS